MAHSTSNTGPAAQRNWTRLRDIIEADWERLVRFNRALLMAEISKGRYRPQLSIKDESMDIAAEVCLQAYATAERFDASRAALPWLRGISRKVVRSTVRDEGRARIRRQPAGAVHAAAGGEDAPPDRDSLARLHWADDRPRLDARIDLEQHLRRLPRHEREMLRLRYQHGWSVAELSIRFQKKESAVAVSLWRARNRLRKGQTAHSVHGSATG